MIDDLWGRDDPFNSPLWEEAERTARNAKEGFTNPHAGYVGCPMSWLKQVLPLVSSERQLAVVLLMYRHLRWDKAVPIPNAAFEYLGIDRGVKYRALVKLERAGLITVERTAGHTVGVKLVLVS